MLPVVTWAVVVRSYTGERRILVESGGRFDQGRCLDVTVRASIYVGQVDVEEEACVWSYPFDLQPQMSRSKSLGFQRFCFCAHYFPV